MENVKTPLFIFKVRPESGFTLNDKSPLNVLREVTTLDLCREPTISLGGTI